MKSLLVITCILIRGLHAGSTIAQDDAFAWSGNAGWINLHADETNGVVIGDAFLSGYAWSGNVGWINFGDGSPANGYAYSNASATDFGVNHDGAGRLTGYAYGANIGWIHFGWAAADDPDRPRLDLLTGNMTGYAYSANIGWINLGSGFLRTGSILYADADNDGISDAWEMLHFGNTTVANGSTDTDGDGASDLAESIANTLPNDADSRLRILSYREDTVEERAEIQFTSSPSRIYLIEHSDDLSAWSDPYLIGTFAPSAGEITTRAFDHRPGTRWFFRVSAYRPLLAPAP